MESLQGENMIDLHTHILPGVDDGVAKEHQVIDLVAGVEQETAHGGVRNLLIHKGYRTMMETD